MANYFCTDSVEEQVDYLTDKVTDLNTKKLDKAAIVQETGIGTDVVMSQKAVTDQLDKKSDATNLENGAGLDSLVQKYSGQVDETHYASSTTGVSDVCLGEANTSSGKRNVISGKLNTNTGSNNLITGLQNNIASNHNVVGGQHNTINQGHDNLIGGFQNTANGKDDIVAGIGNTVNSYGNIVAGHGNTVSEDGPLNLVAGEQNILGKVVNSIICGDNNNNEIKQLIGGIKAGHDLLNNSDIQGKALLGHYNSPKTNTLVEIGNGTGIADTERKNAFEVLVDGRAKVQSAPVENDDVVRKADLAGIGGGKVYLHKLTLSVPNTEKLSNIAATLYVYSSTSISFVEKRPKGTIYGTASISCKRSGDTRDYYGTAVISTPNGSFTGNRINHFNGPVVLLGALDNSTYVFSVNSVFIDIAFTDTVIEL